MNKIIRNAYGVAAFGVIVMAGKSLYLKGKADALKELQNESEATDDVVDINEESTEK